MCDQLDRLQRDYRAMLLHGIVPTGLLIDQQTLSAIASDSLRSDPRLEWGEDGLDRLFGFRPQIAEGVAKVLFQGRDLLACGSRAFARTGKGCGFFAFFFADLLADDPFHVTNAESVGFDSLGQRQLLVLIT